MKSSKSPKWCVTEYFGYRFGLILSQKAGNFGFQKCRVLQDDGSIKEILLFPDEIVPTNRLKIG